MTEKVVSYQPRPRNRVHIKLSGGRFFTIPESEASSFPMGAELSVSEVERLSRIDQYLRGKEKTLRLLAIRSRSTWELRQALEKLELDSGVVDGVLDELASIGLVDDLRFAKEYVRVKVDLKGLGPHRLRFELKQMRIRSELIDQALDEVFEGECQEELAWTLARKKIGSGNLDEKIIRRTGDMLKRRGFDFEIVSRITYELLREARLDESR